MPVLYQSAKFGGASLFNISAICCRYQRRQSASFDLLAYFLYHAGERFCLIELFPSLLLITILGWTGLPLYIFAICFASPSQRSYYRPIPRPIQRIIAGEALSLSNCPNYISLLYIPRGGKGHPESYPVTTQTRMLYERRTGNVSCFLHIVSYIYSKSKFAMTQRALRIHE